MTTQHVEIVIVGSGFSGLAMAHALRSSGRDDLLVLERSGEVGGVWQANTYPGLTCDVPSHLYSLSAAPNPEWSSTYSPQDEIRAYLQGCVDRFGLRPYVRTGVDVLGATWEESETQWRLDTTAGPMSCDVLISAAGALTEPRYPAVPGIERFEGTLMHSARWDHEHDLSGERVASIGTGASAIQYVPEIADRVEHLYVFQRTAPWVVPHGKRDITDVERALYRRVPAVQQLVRGGVYAGRELLAVAFTKRPELVSLLEAVARRHREHQISDPALLDAVTPDYRLGCKRLVPSNRWYPTLGRPHVDLVPGALAEVRPRSVVGEDGVERPVDTIIFGTGYHVTDNPFAGRVRGSDGRTLAETWAGSPRAYLGTSVPGFPNFFLLLGPNTGLGHSSMVYMLESTVEHVRDRLMAMDAVGADRIEVSEDAYQAYNDELDRRLERTIWAVGRCSSYYLDANGRNAAQWPDVTWRFRRLSTRHDEPAYRMRRTAHSGSAAQAKIGPTCG